MSSSVRCLCLWVVLACAVSSALAQAPAAAFEEAEALFRAGEWAAAARAFEAIVQAHPGDANAWFRLGAARHQLGEFTGAVEAYQRAQAAGFRPPAQLLLHLARAQARAGDVDKALTALSGLLRAGFLDADALQNDPELAPLRGQPRFAEIVAEIDRAARLCDLRPEFRQFDFWLGEWDVHLTGGLVQAGRSRIERILAGCVILENWTGVNGYSGKSFNLYDAASGKWEQYWVDSRGGRTHFVGEARDGNLYYTARTPDRDGKTILRRLTFFQLGPGRIRQFSERSTDNGQTWSVEYDLTYERRKP